MAEILQQLLQWAQLPGVGLSTLFVTSFVSATLIPLGAEPILFGYISLRPDMYWVAIGVATLGNSLGGLFDWWMGLLARNAYESLKGPTHYRIGKWLERSGPILGFIPDNGGCVLYFEAGRHRRRWERTGPFFGSIFLDCGSQAAGTVFTCDPEGRNPVRGPNIAERAGVAMGDNIAEEYATTVVIDYCRQIGRGPESRQTGIHKANRAVTSEGRNAVVADQAMDVEALTLVIESKLFLPLEENVFERLTVDRMSGGNSALESDDFAMAHQ